jgi:DNA-binding CsgD family transcriptional regulator
MIVHETYAICGAVGCGARELIDSDDYPKRWPEMTYEAGGESQHFCSQVCLLAAAGGYPLVKSLPMGLTPQDVVVLGLLAQGYTNKEINGRCGFAGSGAKNHLTHIFQVLHSPTRIEAVFRAHDLGVLNVNETARLCNDRLMGRVG